MTEERRQTLIPLAARGNSARLADAITGLPGGGHAGRRASVRRSPNLLRR